MARGVCRFARAPVNPLATREGADKLVSMRVRTPILVRSFVAAACLIAAACATTDFVTGQKTRNMYSIAEDIQLGEKVLAETMAEMKKKGIPIDQDKKKLAQLQEMVRRIAAVSHIPDLPYEVHLFDDPEIVNAMCAPGGKVLVFTGLYTGKDAIVHDDDELAAVLGHEIAHATCRHTTESITREMPINLLLAAGSIYAEVQNDSDVAAGVGAAFLVSHGLLFTKYSRTDEAEADAVGLLYTAKAGYDPRAAPRLWKQVYKDQGDAPGLVRWFSTHPGNRDRWKALQRQLPDALREYEKAKGLPPGSISPDV